MYTYHLKNILECNGYNNKVVLDKMKIWGCEYDRASGLVTNWQEKLIPEYAPFDYLELISRLDDEFLYEYDGETFKPTSRVQRSGRIYTSMTSSKQKLNFQASKSQERSKFTWKGQTLESFDVSASQLRVALALRGCCLPFSTSPWDSLIVDHPVNDLLPADMARELKKTVGLLLVRGEKRVDYKKAWLEKIKAPAEHMPRLTEYKSATEIALLTGFPCLTAPLPVIKSTPDGYSITHRSASFGKHHIHSRPLGIKTSYKKYTSEPPTEANVLEAFEAYVIREVIRSLPHTSPILTCHDQVYVLNSDTSSARESFERAMMFISKYTDL